MDRQKILNGEEFTKTYEVCPHCGEEVELDAELNVQTCPVCGKRIVACSMCLACVEQDGYCTKCCLCYQAEVENKLLDEQNKAEIERENAEIDEIDKRYKDRGVFQIVNEIDEFHAKVTGTFPTYRDARNALKNEDFHDWFGARGTGAIFFEPFYVGDWTRTRLYKK